MARNDPWKQAVRDAIEVPPHVASCVNAVLYDLMHGPSYVRIPYGNVENFNDDCLATYANDLEDECVPECGDIIEQTYVGRVGDTVRAFIQDLPCEAWVDVDCDCYMDREPEQYEANPDYDPDDEDSEEPDYFENDMSSVYHLDRKDIVSALFGGTFAREFS